jgi:carbon monoxide dehydrogenase subunit G
LTWDKGAKDSGTMDFGGRYHVAASREAVWRALNDASVLKACIPGCQRLEWTGADTLALEIRVNLGVVKPVFAGELSLSGVVPAESYTLTGRGKGGVLGLAHGAADVILADDGDGTELRFKAHGSASARIMQFGQVLIGDRAQKIIDGFFVHFGEVMGATVTPLEL